MSDEAKLEAYRLELAAAYSQLRLCGWHPFGSPMEDGVELEFSDVKGQDGRPAFVRAVQGDVPEMSARGE